MESKAGQIKRVNGRQESEYYRAKDYLSKGLDILRDGLQPFVEGVLTDRDGQDWHQHPRIQRMISISAQEYEKTGPPLDVAAILRIIGSEAYWHRTFRLRLPGISLWMIDSLKELRNRIAHNDGKDLLFKDRQLVLQMLVSMQMLLKAAEASNSMLLDDLISQVSPSIKHRLKKLVRGQSHWSIPIGSGAVAATALIGAVALYASSPRLGREIITIGTADPQIENYQQLRGELEKRLKRNSFFDFITGKGVEVRLEHAKSYPEAIARLKNFEWQVLFGYSPVVSMTAAEEGYKGIGLMFSSEPNYRTVFFSKKGSQLKSIDSINERTRIALGDPFSASKYYVPISMLKGKKLEIIENNSTKDIVSLVRNDKADIGVMAGNLEDFPTRHKDLKIISSSPLLPQSIVAVSPFVSESDRLTIQKVLFSIPKSKRGLGREDYGPGKQPDYSALRRIVELAKTLSACVQTESGKAVLGCPKASQVTSYLGWIDDITPIKDYAVLRIGTTDGREILARASRDLLRLISAYDTLEKLRSRHVRITVANPAGSTERIEYELTSPNQIEIVR
jgi:ABC-type phosphate/phosphonate transport system substrate-binding protein